MKKPTSIRAPDHERTRASTKALKASGGARKNFRFTASMVHALKVASGHYPDLDQTQIVALALDTLNGRRKEVHQHRVDDPRHIKNLPRRAASAPHKC